MTAYWSKTHLALRNVQPFTLTSHYLSLPKKKKKRSVNCIVLHRLVLITCWIQYLNDTYYFQVLVVHVAERLSIATVTGWVALSRPGTMPKHTVKIWEENWWKLTARTKTTLSWRSRGKKLRWRNKFGSASGGTRSSSNSSGVTTRFQFSRNGLQMNQMEKTKWNHAGTCGLGTKAVLAGHLGHGMTSLVEFVQTFPVVLSARGFPIIDKQSFLTIKAESNARQSVMRFLIHCYRLKAEIL